MNQSAAKSREQGKQIKKRIDLTEGSPGRRLLLFALPMILGNLFQQFYNMADSMIVGNFVGEDALAAVGASYALTNVFIMIAIGGRKRRVGFDIPVSGSQAARKNENLHFHGPDHLPLCEHSAGERGIIPERPHTGVS